MISFNIKQGLDFNKLNYNISTFKSAYEQEPIISWEQSFCRPVNGLWRY